MSWWARHKEKRREYMRAWLKKYRENIIEFLGGVCVNCGTEENLEFDHIQPIRENLAYLSSSSRMARYAREAKAGKIQLLCRSCNASKNARDTVQMPLVDEPF